MAVLPIYTYGTPVLRRKAKTVEKVDDAVIRLIVDMFETMHAASGIGLAANQIGVLRRVIVIDVSDASEETKEIKPLVLINPEIISQNGLWTMEEGCLSIPDVRDDVERPELIRFRFRDANFNEAELEAGGLLGRVVLHEIDHLNGTLFLDRLSTAKRRTHSESLRRIQRGEIETGYPIIPASTEAVP